jgi:hypothetical protein
MTRFFFAPIDLYNVALTRMILGFVWIVMYGLRLLDFEIFYGDQGLVPGTLAQSLLPIGHQSPWPFYFESAQVTWWLHVLFVIFLLGFAFGLYARSLTWALFLLHVGFMQRNYSIVYGADLFTGLWLFYLSFVKHNRWFSLWNLRAKWKDRSRAESQIRLPQIESDPWSTMGVRLIQVHLCVSYAYTGIEKLKGSQWWEGVAVWHVLGMKEILPMDLTFLQNFPLVIGLLTITTVLFEVYFPAAMLSSRVRPWWLIMGLIFHGMTGIFMSLPFFCLTMVTPYLLFLDSRTVRETVWLLKTRLRPQ